MSSEEGHSGQAESAEDAKDVGSGRETPASPKGACSGGGGGGGAAARQVEVGDAALLSPRSGELSPNTRKLIENLAGGVDEVRENASEDASLPAAVGRDGGAEAGPGAGGVADRVEAAQELGTEMWLVLDEVCDLNGCAHAAGDEKSERQSSNSTHRSSRRI